MCLCGLDSGRFGGPNTYLLHSAIMLSTLRPMARLARIVTPGMPHHITQRGPYGSWTRPAAKGRNKVMKSKATKRKVFNGLCQVIIQSSRDAGQIELTAQSPGLKPGTSCTAMADVGQLILMSTSLSPSPSPGSASASPSTDSRSPSPSPPPASLLLRRLYFCVHRSPVRLLARNDLPPEGDRWGQCLEYARARRSVPADSIIAVNRTIPWMERAGTGNCDGRI